MPDGLVNVPDALEYSTDELYMKYLPRLQEIKDWMQSNTYHMELKNLNSILNKMYNGDSQDLMNENSKLRNELLNDFQGDLKRTAQYGKQALGLKLPCWGSCFFSSLERVIGS